jgi:hypothetical protein
MDAARRQVVAIAGRALLLLPVFLAAWHFTAIGTSWVAGKVATLPIAMVTDGVVRGAMNGDAVTYAVTLEMPYRGGETPRVSAEVEVLPRKFTYGIALFLALAFAARESRQRGVAIVFGAAVLLVLPGFGVAFDALKQLGSTAELAPFLRWGGATREAIALGWQAGTLLLPPLAPVVLWLAIVRPIWAPDDLRFEPGGPRPE